jgi:hypothetical protein
MRFADEAEAQTAVDAFDWTPQLIDRDYQDLSLWVRNKNASDDFDFTNRDLTLLEGEERLLVEFATSGGNEALSLAWWVEDMNPPTFKAIADRLALDTATRTRITDRAGPMVAVEPVYDVVEDI